MLSKGIHEAINEQIKHELDSAYLYLAMSAYCETLNLPGFASWLRVQWQEETSHAMKFFRYLVDRGGKVTLQGLGQPPSDFKSPLELFRQVLAHEQKVTGLIHRLYEMAQKENDFATQVELDWFVKEQVEEEKSAGEIVAMMTMAGESGTPLIMIDRQLAARGGQK